MIFESQKTKHASRANDMKNTDNKCDICSNQKQQHTNLINDFKTFMNIYKNTV